MKQCLLLYSHCILVKGISRSTICDLQRREVHLIPNSLANLFEESRWIDTEALYRELDDESSEIVTDYLAFLNKNELAFYCTNEELLCFPKMSEEWLSPAHISNCVLDTSSTFEYFNENFLQQLERLCCNFIQFRFFNPVNLPYLYELMAEINRSQIKSVEMILPALSDSLFVSKIVEFVQDNQKINNIVIFNAHSNEQIKEGVSGMGYVFTVKENITGVKHCGKIGAGLFVTNISTYTESLHYNTCLNRKIAIDTDGRIKNCPSMQEDFGNIKDTTLEEAVQAPGFKKHWNITKDQIIKCKDCEFRHVCTDCRAYTDNPEDIYSAPLKCGYNPYNCTWEDWSTNLLKQKAISYYGMN